MRISLCGKVLLAGACMMTGLTARGQQAASPAKQTPASFDVAITYNLMQGNRAGNGTFWMQGGSVQVHRPIWRGLGAAADVAGLDTANMNLHIHNTNVSTTPVGLDMVTAVAGPRYTWSPAHGRLSVFGHALAGEAFGMHSAFAGANGTESSASSFALKVGGGLNLRVNRRLSVRAFEADWLRTQLPNSTNNVQNNLRLGAGIVFHLR